MQQSPQPFISIAISLVIVSVILFFRFRNMNRQRPLKLERLWVVPVIYGCIAVYLFYIAPPHGLGWLWSALALAVGCAVGWYRGKMIHIEVDPETHRLSQKTSPAAMLFLVALIFIRMGSRALLGEMATGPGSIGVMTDILVAFALGFLALQRLEMAIRARRLLAAGRSDMVQNRL